MHWQPTMATGRDEHLEVAPLRDRRARYPS